MRAPYSGGTGIWSAALGEGEKPGNPEENPSSKARINSKLDSNRAPDLDPVSRKLRKLFGPVKP